MINSVLRPKSVSKNSQITLSIEDGVEYSSPQDIANLHNSFYASVGRNIPNPFNTDNQYTASSLMVNSFYFKRTTESEIS